MTTNTETASLELQLRILQDRYRTEQSLRAAEERGRIEAQTQLDHIRKGADMYGVLQSLALNGKKHPKEPPMDGRLDAIRSLVAHNAKLSAELAEVQRLYERATKEAMALQRKADRLLPESIGAEELE